MEVPVARNASPKLEVRNLRFATNTDEVPRHWHGGKKAVTSFFDNLSIFFPHGERFFIDAVKAHKHLVTDEQLLEEIGRFCAQEGIHAREHVRYNEMLEAQGYPAAKLDRKVKRILENVRRVLPTRMQLSATCALEHFTSLMGHFVLSDPRLLEGAHPVMASLWRWHAAEETEHRAVAWDVYRAARGPYIERAGTMLFTTATFWALVIQHQVKMMKVDGTQWSPAEWRSLFVYLFIEPGGMPQLWRRWLDYFKPSFHPWEHDNGELLEQWKNTYAPAAVRATATP
jgi:predicted metal-dependent hydrolase